MSDDNEIPELPEAERARWEAAQSVLRGLAEAATSGTPDNETLAAAIAQTRQIDLDMERVRDSLHIPEDAGECREALTALLRRIPNGWGRWISCDAGWYPLVTGLDAQLAELDPEYELHQVKEKFGALRYYAHTASSNDEIQSAFWARIDEAEKRSEVICERCGWSATGCRLGSWLKTLCPSCATDLGYSPIPGEASADE